MKFLDWYTDNHHIRDIIPVIFYKVSDGVRFKGKKVSYEDFTSFVFHDNTWTPAMFARKEHVDCEKVNLVSVLSVGLAELLDVCSITDDEMIDYLLKEISENIDLCVEDCIEIAQQLMSDMETGGVNDDFLPILLGTSMRRTYVKKNKERMDSLVTLLCLVAYFDFGLWVDIFFQVMLANLGLVAPWVEDASNLTGHSSASLSEQSDLEMQIYGRVNKSGRKGYKIPGTKTTRYVSDSAGFGIRLCCLLCIYCLENFGEPASSVSLLSMFSVEKHNEKIQKRLNACLGNDFFARWVSGRGNKGYIVNDNDLRDINCNTIMDKGYYTLSNDRKVCREVYESEYLFRASHGMKQSNNFLGVNMCYYTIRSLAEGCGVILGYSDDKGVEAYLRDCYEKEKAMLKQAGLSFDKVEDLKEECKSLGLTVSSLKDKLNKEREEYEINVEDLTKQIAELQTQLSSKSNIIKNMTEKIKDLHSRLQSTYVEEEMDEVEDELTLSDMIDYLKDFRILHLGGRTGFQDKLNKLGLENGLQVFKPTEVTSAPDVDFIVVHTKFNSHQLFKAVHSRYKNTRDIIFYYNGINTDQFIRAYYDFVRRFLEDE